MLNCNFLINRTRKQMFVSTLGFSTLLDLINTTKASRSHQNMHVFSFVQYNRVQSHRKKNILESKTMFGFEGSYSFNNVTVFYICS